MAIDRVTTEVTPGGIMYPRHIDKERREAEKLGPLEIQNADTHDRISGMMRDLRNMNGFRLGGVCLEPGTKAQIKARQRLWRHFCDEILGTDWDCEVLC